MRDGLEFIVDLISEFSLVVAIPKFFVVVDTVDGLALVAHLHEEVGVVVGLLSVEVDVGRLVYLELLVNPLVHLLLVQTLAMNTHLLSEIEGTETGSLTFLTESGVFLEAMDNITYWKWNDYGSLMGWQYSDS